MEDIVIPRYFRGPPETSNGGYAAGLAAEPLAGPAIAKLFKPPPIDVPLHVRRAENRVEILD